MSVNPSEAATLLAKVPAFSQLSAEQLAPIAQVAVPRRFKANTVIFHEGDSSDTCYIVRTGSAQAVREHADGRTIALATFGIGDIFGELAMFNDEARSATVESVTDLEVIAILGSDMRWVLRSHPDIAVQLVQTLGSRLREVNERLARQSFHSVQSRVAAVLIDLIENQRKIDSSLDRDLVIRTRQSDLAKFAGTSRESTSRFMAKLQRDGVVKQGRGKVTVHDPELLKRYIY